MFFCCSFGIFSQSANLAMEEKDLLAFLKSNETISPLEKELQGLLIDEQEVTPDAFKLKTKLLNEFLRAEASILKKNSKKELNCSQEDLKKINLIIGPAESPQHSLRELFRPKTETGVIYNAYLFSRPITDVHELTMRASIIKTLKENPELLEQIEEIVKKIQEAEQALGNNDKKSDLQEQFQNIYFDENGPLGWGYLKDLSQKLNTSKIALTFMGALNHASKLQQALPNILRAYFSYSLLENLLDAEKGISLDPKDFISRLNPITKIKNGVSAFYNLYQWKHKKYLPRPISNTDFVLEPTNTPHPSIKDVTYKNYQALLYGQDVENYTKTEKFPAKTPSERSTAWNLAVFAGFSQLAGSAVYDYYQNMKPYAQYQRDHLAALQKIHASIKAIEYMLAAYNELQKICKNHPDIFQHCFTHSAEFNQMQKNIFQNNISLAKDLSPLMLLIKEGEILASSKHIQNNQDYLFNILADMAKLDVYSTIARQFMQIESANNPITHVTFLEQQQPQIIAINFWNPLVQEHKAVCNSITLAPNKARNILLTGPNGSGKSTNIKGIILNIFLAQTIGFAFSESFSLTPYTDFWAAFNEQENIATGQSAFMAEKKRLETLRKQVLSLPKNQKAFLFMDEPVKGTIEELAGDKIYQECRTMAQQENCTILLVTHTAEPLNLEQATNGAFANYYVDVLEHENKKDFIQTFKMLQGKPKWWFSNKDRRRRFVEFLN